MKNPLYYEPMTSDATSEELPVLTTRHRMPDVIMIGAAKSATTFLTRWIAQHPAVGVCNFREPNFFSHPDRFARGLDWYNDLYRGVRRDQLAFDSSTGYTQWPQYPLAAPRIAHFAPRAKLIYLMRNPIDRAYSHYIHRWTKERHFGEPFTKTFEEYVLEDPLCVDGSNYRAQLERYLEYFSRDDLLCLFTFELRAKPLDVIQKICRFLGIDDDPAPFGPQPSQDNRTDQFLESRVRVSVTDRIKQIPGVKQALPRIPRAVRESLYQVLRRSRLGKSTAQQFEAPPLSPTVRCRLREQFVESNAWIAELTGQDLSCWNE